MGSLLQHQSTRETLVDEVHAIPASIHRPIIPTIADRTDNHMVISQDHHDNIQNIRPVHGFQLPPFMNNSNAVVNTGMFSSNLNELHSSSDHTNPFIPPPLPVNILKKIEKDDFVSFEDLLPSTPSTATTSRDEHFIDIDIESSALRLRQKEKSKRIINLSSWMLAWNNFMQTTLHFKPGRYFVLFCYQKNFCRLVSKYRFDACYRYDKDFRLLVASQSSLSPEQRTARWEDLHSELSSMHLQQDTLLPTCFHCRNTGHFAPNCPLKNTGNDNAFRNVVNTSQTFIPRFPSSHPSQSGQSMEISRYTPNKQQPMSLRSPTTCNRFNRGNFCAKPPCKFSHVCNKCNQGHPGVQCNSTSSSFFIPQSR